MPDWSEPIPPPTDEWPEGSRDPVDIELREHCRWDLGLYGKTFFPHIFPLPYNQVHLDYHNLYCERHGSRGHRDAVAAPRGSSKTTGGALLKILHACAYRTETFVLYVTNRADNAEEKIKQVRDELTDNLELQRVYGHFRGLPWNQGHFHTRRTENHPGVTVMSGGRFTQFRGATQQFLRPSIIFADDVEYPEQVLSEIQRHRTHAWLYNDIFKLGQPQTNIEVSGTILHPQSLLQEILESPGWTTRFYQAVTTFADSASLPLWQEWRGLFIDKTNPRNEADARAFFEAHEAAMMLDAQVLWPEHKDYYALMVERIVEGEASFWQELMNAPMGDQRYLFDLREIAYCTLLPEGIRRGDGTFVPWLDVIEFAAFFDPALGRGKDCACCVVVCCDKNGFEYILDVYITNTESPEDQDEAIVDILWKWKCNLLAIESNGYQSLLPRNIREALSRSSKEKNQQFNVKIVSVTHTRNKILRIKTLEPPLKNHWIQMARNLPSEYYRQFGAFIPIERSGRDDGPDATEGAIAVVRGMFRKQDVV